MLCQMFNLPGSEIFQHSPAQNFDPMAPLLQVFFHSVWEKLWLLIANSHLWIEKGGEMLIFFPSGGEEGAAGARGGVMAVSCHPYWNLKDSLCAPRKHVPAQLGQRQCCSLEVLVDKWLPWAHSTLVWGSCPDFESHCNKMVPDMDGSVLPKRWLHTRWAWAVPPASLLPPIQEGQHPLMCEAFPASHGV